MRRINKCGSYALYYQIIGDRAQNKYTHKLYTTLRPVLTVNSSG